MLKNNNWIGFAFGPIFGALLSVSAVPMLAWLVSTENVGRLSFFVLIVSLGVNFLSLGLHQAYVRFYLDVIDTRVLFNRIVVISIGAYFVLALSSILVWPQLVSFILGESSYIYFLYFHTTLFFSLMNHHLVHEARMEGASWSYFLFMVLPKLVIVLIYAMCFVFQLDVDIGSLLVVHVFSVFVGTLILSMNRRSRGGMLNPVGEVVSSKALLLFSLPLMLSGFTFWASNGADRVFIRSYLNLSDLGVYSLAMSLVGSAKILHTVFSNFWQPAIFKWHKKYGYTPKMISLSSSVFEGLILVLALIWCFAGLAMPMIFELLPDDYSRAQFVFMPLLASVFTYIIADCSSIGLSIKKYTKTLLCSSILFSIIVVALLWLFTDSYKLEGVAGSVLIAFIFLALFRLEASNKVWLELPRFWAYFCLIFYWSSTIVIFGDPGLSKGLYIAGVCFFSVAVIAKKSRVRSLICLLKDS